MQDVAIIIGEQAFTWAQVALAFAGAFLVLMVWVAVSLARVRNATQHELFGMSEQSRDLEGQLQSLAQLHADMNGRLHTVAELFGARQAEMVRTLNERLDHVQTRVGQGLEASSAATQASLAQLQERLAVIDGAQGRLTNLADEMVSLRHVLTNKQTRGAFGQAQMEAIVRDSLPASAYAFQAQLPNGKRPDCVVYLPGDERPLAIDAKFPLESFTALRESRTAEERKVAASAVRRDISTHIKDVAERYLLAGATQDMALLFVPSESLYADLHEHFDDLIQQAFRARVIIVSPSLLMLSVQMVRASVRDAGMREQVHALQAEIGHLVGDVRRLGERMGKLDTHFRQAQDDLMEASISKDKILRRGAKIEALDVSPVQTSLPSPSSGNNLSAPTANATAPTLFSAAE
jgi:DNA recombination protein RmuC